LCYEYTRPKNKTPYKNSFLRLAKMEQGEEQEDDEQGNDKGENPLQEHHHH